MKTCNFNYKECMNIQHKNNAYLNPTKQKQKTKVNTKQKQTNTILTLFCKKICKKILHNLNEFSCNIYNNQIQLHMTKKSQFVHRYLAINLIFDPNSFLITSIFSSMFFLCNGL